jgi:formylglycine-generating enzyme required for sulfatase activity
MKRTWLFIGLLSSVLLFTSSIVNALTIPASEDSYTAAGNKLSHSTNNANSLLVDGIRKAYLFFDLSDIPADAVVRWAKLRLFLPTVRTPGAGLSVHLVTGTWNESSRISDAPVISAGSLGMIAPEKMASRRFVTVDVKDVVQKWVNGGTLNEGFAVQPIVKAGSPTASVMLTSKEGPVFGLPAELDIEFGPAFDTLPLSIRTYFGPTITAQPIDPVSVGGDSLMVSASGMGPLAYQWMRNGIAIEGATSQNLSLFGLGSGTYTVLVTNSFTSVTSGSVHFIAPTKLPSPIGNFALVTGGTLPASSSLGTMPVPTFYIGKTEITVGEWWTVRAWAVANGYADLPSSGPAVPEYDTYPMLNVNWYDCVKWCNARSEKEGKTPVYKDGNAVYRTGEVLDPQIISSANGYRLPSDAEWEFAARGGTQTKGYTYSGSNNVDAVGWYSGNSGMLEIAQKQANELGIYDMSGNVSEWCGGWYTGLEERYRMVRGGDWYHPADSLRIAAFMTVNPMLARTYIGFRVATSGEYALGITAQPSLSSDGTRISVQAESASTLAYQWMRNGVVVSGGTNAALLTQGLQSGTYTVVVSNGLASVTSGIVQFGAPSPIGAFVLVSGGTLPASSELGSVTVDAFYIGKTEVTWSEWQTVRMWALENGYTDLANVGEGIGGNYPVTHVNWYDCVKWCNARSEKEGKTPVYKNGNAVYRTGTVSELAVVSLANGYRLPSEKEWEFAARGGTQTKGYTYSGSNDLHAVGWYHANSGSAVHEVGKKLANELGIFDMSGNLSEWSENWYPAYEGSYRVTRGGNCHALAELCIYRVAANADSRGLNYGFRVSRSVP